MKRFRLTSFVTTTLVLSGLFQSAVTQFHISMIINLFSTIIGFYLFGFTLMTIMNILNGANFSSKKSLVTLLAIYLITTVQIVFGALFIQVALNEVQIYEEVALNNEMLLSIAMMTVSMVCSVLACIGATTYYRRENEIDQYLG